jgi:hypothetical protein
MKVQRGRLNPHVTHAAAAVLLQRLAAQPFV